MDKVLCFSAPVNENENGYNNVNNIIFTIKDTQSYVPVVFLPAKGNRKLSKWFQKSVYWNEYKTKRENKNMTNEYKYFLESNFFGGNRLFILVYSNQNNNSKKFKTKRYDLPKEIIDHYNVIINEKKLYNQPIDSDIRRYEEIRKLTTEQGEDYTTGCLLVHDYIKNNCRLITVDLSRQKELDTDPKAIQQTEFIEQSTNPDNGIVTS